MVQLDRQRLRLGAALFNGDHGHLADEVTRLKTSGLNFIHLDVFDGHFVSDLGFPPRTIASLRPLTDMPFEVHLGANDPLRFVPHLVEAGVNLIIFHVEIVDMPYEAAYLVREHKVSVGMAITLGTPVSSLESLLTSVDAVLLLSRVTGEGVKGASFDPQVLPRVRRLREMADAAEITLDIQIAGGVKRQHLAALVQAGATSVAMGGGLYRVPDMALEVKEMRQLVAGIHPD